MKVKLNIAQHMQPKDLDVLSKIIVIIHLTYEIMDWISLVIQMQHLSVKILL